MRGGSPISYLIVLLIAVSHNWQYSYSNRCMAVKSLMSGTYTTLSADPRGQLFSLPCGLTLGWHRKLKFSRWFHYSCVFYSVEMTRIVQGWSSISFSFPHGLSMWLAWTFAQPDGLPTSHMLVQRTKVANTKHPYCLFLKVPECHFLLILLVIVVTGWLKFKRRWNRFHLLIGEHQGNHCKMGVIVSF